MRTVVVVVADELLEDASEGLLVPDQHMIQTLPAQRSDDTLGDGIGLRSPIRRAQGLDAESDSTRNEGRAVATGSGRGDTPAVGSTASLR